MFGNPRIRAAQHDWDSVARFVVGTFRADAARAGAVSEVSQLVEELCHMSPDFKALWRENDVGVHGEGVKRLRHPTLGSLELEYSAFAVDGRPDLGMIVYNPISAVDAERIRSLVMTQVPGRLRAESRYGRSMPAACGPAARAMVQLDQSPLPKAPVMAIGFIRRWQRQRQRRRKPAPPPALAAAPRDPSRCALLVLAHPALHRSQRQCRPAGRRPHPD